MGGTVKAGIGRLAVRYARDGGADPLVPWLVLKADGKPSWPERPVPDYGRV